MTLNDILIRIENADRLNIIIHNITFELHGNVNNRDIRKIRRRAKRKGHRIVIVKKGECTEKERDRSLRMGYDIIDTADITDIRYNLFMYEHGENLSSRGRNTFKALITQKFKEFYRINKENNAETESM